MINALSLTKKENFEVLSFLKSKILLINIDNCNLSKKKELLKAINKEIVEFMKQLGDNYSSCGTKYKIKVNYEYKYIDLLLYNIKNRCFVVIKFILNPLKEKDIHDLNVCIKYIDKNKKDKQDNNTLGIIIRSKNNSLFLDYYTDSKIITM